MAESSIWWTTDGTGDGVGGGYTQAQLIKFFSALFVSDDTDEGVAMGYSNELAVSGAATPVSVAAGAALCYGFGYFSTAAENVAVPTPAGNTRIDRIVLQADWTAQTVRIARIAGVEGAGTPPALTQTDGTKWEISLAQASITTGGVITLTDEREWLHPNIEIETAMIEAGAVTATEIADDAVDSQHYVNGSIDTVHVGDSQITPIKIPDRTRTKFVPATHGYNVTDIADIDRDAVQLHTSLKNVIGYNCPDSKACIVYGLFRVPEDFASAMTVQAVVVPQASGNIYGDTLMEWSADNEAWGGETASSGSTAHAIVDEQHEELAAVSLANVALGDIVQCYYNRLANLGSDTIGAAVITVGFLVSYTADS